MLAFNTRGSLAKICKGFQFHTDASTPSHQHLDEEQRTSCQSVTGDVLKGHTLVPAGEQDTQAGDNVQVNFDIVSLLQDSVIRYKALCFLTKYLGTAGAWVSLLKDATAVHDIRQVLVSLLGLMCLPVALVMLALIVFSVMFKIWSCFLHKAHKTSEAEHAVSNSACTAYTKEREHQRQQEQQQVECSPDC